MIIECNEINPYYVYRHRRLDTFEIFYVGTTGLVMDIPYVCPE